MKTFTIACAVGAAALLASACNQPEETTVPADEMATADTMAPADDGMGAGGMALVMPSSRTRTSSAPTAPIWATSSGSSPTAPVR